MITFLIGLLILISCIAVLYLALTQNLVRAGFVFFFLLIVLAAVYVFAGAEVPAAALLIIYVGGVLVLLLFGVMLTQRPLPNALASVPSAPRLGSRGSLFGGMVVLALIALLGQALAPLFQTPAPAAIGPSGMALRAIGIAMLTENLLAFELLSIVLLVALVAAASLSRRTVNLTRLS